MQTNGEGLGQTDATVRMTVQEAAALGVTVEAVCGRLHRGKYGLIPTARLPDHEPERSTERLDVRSANGRANGRTNVGSGPAEVVEGLLDEVGFLRAELAERSDALRRREELHGEEIRRRGHIIAGLVERLPPQLEAPSSPTPRDAPQTTGGDAEGSVPRPVAEGSQEAPGLRSWLYRFFFGP